MITLARSNHQSEHYRLEDQLLKFFPKKIRELEVEIDAFTADELLRDSNAFASADNFLMEIDGRTYRTKEKAGDALLQFSKAVMGSEPVLAGHYRGFKIKLFVNPMTMDYHIVLQGHRPHSMLLGDDPVGNITRLNNALDRLSDNVLRAQEQLKNVKHQGEVAKSELLLPWPQENEWAEKSSRLTALNIELSQTINQETQNAQDESEDSMEL